MIIVYGFRAFMFLSLLQFSCFAYSQIDEDSVFIETLELKELQSFQLKDQDFFYSLPNIDNLTLQLKNSLPASAWNKNGFKINPNSTQDHYLNVKIRCDKPIHLEQSPGLFSFNQSRKHRFRLYPSHNNAQKTHIMFNDKNTKCTLSFKFPFDKDYNYSLKLIPEIELYSKTFQNLSEPESCADYNLNSKSSRLKDKDNKNLFFLKNYNILGCAHHSDEIVFLDDPWNAFNERIKLLTGSDIPINVFETQDWTYEPDFSKAPELDLIILSTLQFKSDFTGTLLFKALNFHAQKGTMIRILTTKVLMRSKDRVMLENLVRQSRGHIKLQEFSFSSFLQGDDSEKYSLTNLIDRLHRTNHVKILLTYSSQNPENNAILSGGRNIRDSYYFLEPPDYSDNPNLIQYQDKEEPFIHYVDLEILIKGTELTRQVANQWLALFNRQPQSMKNSQEILNTKSSTLESHFNLEVDTLTRHFISIPYKDNGEMENLFVDMIDSAQKKIRIISPYFQPSLRLMDALNRGIQRNLSIEIITRIDLGSDDIPKISNDVNKQSINKTFQDIAVYEWIEPRSILHAKVFIIDDELSYIGGVNLNKRSFTHDTESGFLLLSHSVARSLNGLFDHVYLKKSEQVTQSLKISWFNSFLIQLGSSFF